MTNCNCYFLYSGLHRPYMAPGTIFRKFSHAILHPILTVLTKVKAMTTPSKIISTLFMGLLIAGCGGGGGGVNASGNSGGNPVSDAKPFMGIHMQLSGTSPFLLQNSTIMAQAFAGQCKQLIAVCALLPAGTNEPSCQNLSKDFQLKGNLADVGKEKVDEYFATGERMRTTRVRSNVLVATAVCGAEIKEVETVKIRQFTATGWIDYERKEDRNKARYWQRTDTAMPSDSVIAMLSSLAPTTGATVSAPAGTDLIATNLCDIYKISGPMVGTICVSKTDTLYPGNLTLAATLTLGSGDIVTGDRRATSVERNIQLNKTDFYPPEGEPVKLIGQ